LMRTNNSSGFRQYLRCLPHADVSVGQSFANEIRSRLPTAGDKWHFDKVVISNGG
jgi:hypothetical protein